MVFMGAVWQQCSNAAIPQSRFRAAFQILASHDQIPVSPSVDLGSPHRAKPTTPPEAAPARGPPLWDQAAEPVPEAADCPAPVPEFVFDQPLDW
jgi:hypothetical protein